MSIKGKFAKFFNKFKVGPETTEIEPHGVEENIVFESSPIELTTQRLYYGYGVSEPFSREWYKHNPVEPHIVGRENTPLPKMKLAEDNRPDEAPFECSGVFVIAEEKDDLQMVDGSFRMFTPDNRLLN